MIVNDSSIGNSQHFLVTEILVLALLRSAITLISKCQSSPISLRLLLPLPMRKPPSLTTWACPQGTGMPPAPLLPLLQPSRDHHVTNPCALHPQAPSPPSPTWPPASPGTWTGSRWTRSTAPGRRSGGGSSQRAWAKGCGRACPAWASASWVRCCRDCRDCMLQPCRQAEGHGLQGLGVL